MVKIELEGNGGNDWEIIGAATIEQVAEESAGVVADRSCTRVEGGDTASVALIQSPTSDGAALEVRSCSNSGTETSAAAVAEKPVVVMKKWQHPAAPFMPFVQIDLMM
ncbi:hypothetical protein SASPL_143525 [Salvia splendens]|uniref:Uncharacterized protein n=1 Tax=Salvia splendens TaxID=180675 RepID=A0A8X8WLS0_SALSN|nr:hypothetical protein SASPL_143525 [Salvia splendens]